MISYELDRSMTVLEPGMLKKRRKALGRVIVGTAYGEDAIDAVEKVKSLLK